MTEMLNKEFSRKSFLKGGGAMVVGFSIARRRARSEGREGGRGPVRVDGPAEPERDRLVADRSIADNTVDAQDGQGRARSGHARPGLLMIAAEELDVSMAQMQARRSSTPNVTRRTRAARRRARASRHGGPQVRAAAAAAAAGAARPRRDEARRRRRRASTVDERRRLRRRQVGHLRRAARRQAVQRAPMPAAHEPRAPGGCAGTKPISQYKLVGTHGVPRIDIPAKVTGAFTYVHNIKVPGMMHGRVVRPRGQGAYGDGTAPKVVSVDESSIKHIAGAQVVRFKDFLGVVAPTGVRGDPGGRAAEGDVGRRTPRCRASATSGSRCATSTRRQDAGPRARRAPATSTGGVQRRRAIEAPADLQVPLQRPRCRSARAARSRT